MIHSLPQSIKSSASQLFTTSPASTLNRFLTTEFLNTVCKKILDLETVSWAGFYWINQLDTPFAYSGNFSDGFPKPAIVHHGNTHIGLHLNNLLTERVIIKGTVVGYLVVQLLNDQFTKITAEVVRSYCSQIEKEHELAEHRQSLEYFSGMLHSLKKEKKENLQAQRLLAQMTAHDLKSPINAVQGYLELIKETLSSSQTRDSMLRYHREANKGIREVLHFINQFEEIFTSSTLADKETLADVDIHWIIEETMSWINAKAVLKSQKITIDFCDEALYSRVNIFSVKRILTNILQNAITYTPPEGHIRISTSFDPEYIYIHIRDNGPGIKNENLKRIFSPFYRASAQQFSEETPSKGLGLYISGLLAKKMGGEILVESKPGHGSVFSIKIPKH